jgi:uncharacterized protein YjbI with pentapeptide repeats
MEDLIHIQKTFEKSLSSTRKSTIENLKIVRLKTVTSLIVTSQQYFMDCEFIDCNLSMTQLRGTSLKTVLAIANYWELNFKVVQTCLELIFVDCVLDYSSFANKKMSQTNSITVR